MTGPVVQVGSMLWVESYLRWLRWRHGYTTTSKLNPGLQYTVVIRRLKSPGVAQAIELTTTPEWMRRFLPRLVDIDRRGVLDTAEGREAFRAAIEGPATP